MLAEPPSTPYDLRFSIAGIPIRVHPLFWLVALFLGFNQPPQMALIWVGVVFVSILVHELGHAVAARGFGYEPRITLHGFGGLASYQPAHYDPLRQITIAAAGPLAGFLLAGIVIAIVGLTGHHLVLFGREILTGRRFESPYTLTLVYDLLFVNIFWGLINLAPVLPLDGGQIARDLLIRVRPQHAFAMAYQLSMVTAVALAIFAWMRFESIFMVVFFGYLAYSSYATWQSYERNRWAP